MLFALLNCLTLSAAELTVSVVNTEQQPADNVVVFLTPTLGYTGPATKAKPILIEQKDKKYAPYLAVAQKGQQVIFSNRDDITHHIYSVSGKNRFDFRLKAGSKEHTQRLGTQKKSPWVVIFTIG